MLSWIRQMYNKGRTWLSHFCEVLRLFMEIEIKWELHVGHRVSSTKIKKFLVVRAVMKHNVILFCLLHGILHWKIEHGRGHATCILPQLQVEDRWGNLALLWIILIVNFTGLWIQWRDRPLGSCVRKKPFLKRGWHLWQWPNTKNSKRISVLACWCNATLPQPQLLLFFSSFSDDRV